MEKTVEERLIDALKNPAGKTSLMGVSSREYGLDTILASFSSNVTVATTLLGSSKFLMIYDPMGDECVSISTLSDVVNLHYTYVYIYELREVGSVSVFQALTLNRVSRSNGAISPLSYSMEIQNITPDNVGGVMQGGQFSLTAEFLAGTASLQISQFMTDPTLQTSTLSSTVFSQTLQGMAHMVRPVERHGVCPPLRRIELSKELANPYVNVISPSVPTGNTLTSLRDMAFSGGQSIPHIVKICFGSDIVDSTGGGVIGCAGHELLPIALNYDITLDISNNQVTGGPITHTLSYNWAVVISMFSNVTGSDSGLIAFSAKGDAATTGAALLANLPEASQTLFVPNVINTPQPQIRMQGIVSPRVSASAPFIGCAAFYIWGVDTSDAASVLPLFTVESMQGEINLQYSEKGASPPLVAHIAPGAWITTSNAPTLNCNARLHTATRPVETLSIEHSQSTPTKVDISAIIKNTEQLSIF
jgi:hypothetical protein